MLTSIAYIFLLGLLLAALFEKCKMPALLGMILTGILLGPYVGNVISPALLEISPDLRQLALVIILTRAGLSLDITDLKKVGRPAILMCFVPACFEIAGVLLLAPSLLGVSILEAAIMGAVLAAVSPAIIVPRMIKLMQEGYGTKKSIPQLLLAGASVDDVFVIVLFTAFTSLASGAEVTLTSFFQIPISVFAGILLGIAEGIVLSRCFKKMHIRDSVKILILLSVSFLSIELEHRLASIVPLSGLLAIMSMGITLYRQYPILAERLSSKYNKLWVASEILLFVLVGAAVNIQYAQKAGIAVVVIVIGGILVRMCGVFVCLIKTKLNKRERIFCAIAYTPKATVQAAIGTIPLSLGLACGQQVLTVAVSAILITAPLGALCIDYYYSKLLQKEQEK